MNEIMATVFAVLIAFGLISFVTYEIRWRWNTRWWRGKNWWKP